MIEGFMKIKEPPIENEILIPQVLFVPCLAFDKFYGYRLGYGGGYYDRTFDYLKHNKRKFLSVGYAFDDQKVNNVPKDRFDMKLDYVITEKKLIHLYENSFIGDIVGKSAREKIKRKNQF